jgi:hypothetical protein
VWTIYDDGVCCCRASSRFAFSFPGVLAVVDAERIFSAHSDRIGNVAVVVLPRGRGIIDHDAVAFG